MRQLTNISDFKSFLNETVVELQLIFEHHGKADSILEVALTGDFAQKPALIIHNFLWALSDIVNQAKNLNENLLNSMVDVVETFKTTPTGNDKN